VPIPIALVRRLDDLDPLRRSSFRHRRPRPAHRLPVGGGHRKPPVSRSGAVAHLVSHRLGLEPGIVLLLLANCPSLAASCTIFHHGSTEAFRADNVHPKRHGRGSREGGHQVGSDLGEHRSVVHSGYRYRPHPTEDAYSIGAQHPGCRSAASQLRLNQRTRPTSPSSDSDSIPSEEVESPHRDDLRGENFRGPVPRHVLPQMSCPRFCWSILSPCV